MDTARLLAEVDMLVAGYSEEERPIGATPTSSCLPPRLDTKLLFSAQQGGYINLDNWRTREWYPALEAAAVDKRGPYHLRHTFATEALANGMPLFQLTRVMGASVKTIEKHYGHLAHDSEEQIYAVLNTRRRRSGVFLASEE